MPPAYDFGGAPLEAQAGQLLVFVTKALNAPICKHSNLLHQSLVDCRFYLGHCISDPSDRSRLRFHDQRGILIWCQFLCREVSTWMKWSPLSLVYHYDDVQSVLQRCARRRPAWPEVPDGIKIEQSDSGFTYLMNDLLTSTVSDQEILNLSKKHAQTVVDSLDSHLSPQPSSSFFRLLGRLCKHHAILPLSFTLVGPVHKQGQFAQRHGGFSDVWKGTYRGQTVAVKALRLRKQKIDLLKSVCYEAALWKHLSHCNIVTLLGVYKDPSGISLISPWMPFGNIMEFLRKFPRRNRLALLTDVARGLCYLHSVKLVHCDLRGANILVDKDGHARLVDFGLSGITHDNESFEGSTSSSRAGAVRWSAPELLFPSNYSMKHRTPTTGSDMYALAMVMWEVLNGKCPFPNCPNPQVILKVHSGERPPHTQRSMTRGMNTEVWALAQACWQDDWTARPSAAHALEVLTSASDGFVAICYDLSDSEDEIAVLSEESSGRTAGVAHCAASDQNDCSAGCSEKAHPLQDNSAAMDHGHDVQNHAPSAFRRTENQLNRFSTTTMATASSLFDRCHSESSRTDLLSDQPDIFKDLPPLPVLPPRSSRQPVLISREVMRKNHVASRDIRNFAVPDDSANKPAIPGQSAPSLIDNTAQQEPVQAPDAVRKVVGTRRPTVSAKQRQLRGQAYVYNDRILARC